MVMAATPLAENLETMQYYKDGVLKDRSAVWFMQSVVNVSMHLQDYQRQVLDAEGILQGQERRSLFANNPLTLKPETLNSAKLR